MALSWVGDAASQQFSFRQYTQSDGLTNLSAGYLVTDAGGDLWVGTDGGLFRSTSGSDATSDASVQLVPGALESSNVNMAAAMTNMIELARSYDMQIKSMKAAEDNDTSSTKLLQTSS